MRRTSNHPDTAAVHAGDRRRLGDYVPVATPIYAAASFFYESAAELEKVFDDQKEGHGYTRYGNPTTAALEEQLAALEGADFAFATSSGMAAMHVALLAATLDRPKRIVAANVLYGQTISMLMKLFEPLGFEVRYADPCDLGAWGDAIAEHKPSCVLLETVSNPLLRVPELDKACAAAREQGATVIVDSTFTTPVLLRPLELGADFVVHSATKFLAGHGDVLAGVLLGRQESRAIVDFLMKTLGPNVGPFEAFLAMRGVKTLPLRIERQCRNARAVAAWLAEQDDVERVYFPGDPGHPDYETARRLFPTDMFGAVVAFDLAGGREAALAFMDGLEIAVPATSLGDLHTMVLYPPMSSHRDLAPKHRERLGIGDGLIRLSVGAEHVADILSDLERGLAAANRRAVATADRV